MIGNVPRADRKTFMGSRRTYEQVIAIFVIVRLGRRDLVWINVTTNPTAEWIARQLAEAFPGVRRRATSSMIRIASMAPWPYAECVPWASGTSLPHRPRLGRMAVPNG